MQWIIDNKDWIFSGAGIFIISIVVGVIVKNKSSSKQIQKSGSNSANYQAGKNINIGKNDD